MNLSRLERRLFWRHVELVLFASVLGWCLGLVGVLLAIGIVMLAYVLPLRP